MSKYITKYKSDRLENLTHVSFVRHVK